MMLLPMFRYFTLHADTFEARYAFAVFFRAILLRRADYAAIQDCRCFTPRHDDAYYCRFAFSLP